MKIRINNPSSAYHNQVFEAHVPKSGNGLIVHIGSERPWYARAECEVVDESPPSASRGPPDGRPSGSSLVEGAIGERRTFEIGKDQRITLRFIPGGTFSIGTHLWDSDSETPREVHLSSHYWMGETEVTQAQWDALMESNPSQFKGNGQLPVETISWDQAQAFVAALNERVCLGVGWKWSLPSEAQWERACRGGGTSEFAHGDALDGNQANFLSNQPFAVGDSYGGGSGLPKVEPKMRTVPVRSYAANGYGLYDMHGNVAEWCLDWFADYSDAAVADPIGPDGGSCRVTRGGNWYNCGRNCRSAARASPTSQNPQDSGIGLRIAIVRSNPKTTAIQVIQERTMKFECPHCGQHLEAEGEWAGMDAVCPNPECGKVIQVPQSQSQPTVPEAPRSELSSMLERISAGAATAISVFSSSQEGNAYAQAKLFASWMASSGCPLEVLLLRAVSSERSRQFLLVKFGSRDDQWNLTHALSTRDFGQLKAEILSRDEEETNSPVSCLENFAQPGCSLIASSEFERILDFIKGGDYDVLAVDVPVVSTTPATTANTGADETDEDISAAIAGAEAEARSISSLAVRRIYLAEKLGKRVIAWSAPDDGADLDSACARDILSKHINHLGYSLGGSFIGGDDQDARCLCYFFMYEKADNS